MFDECRRKWFNRYRYLAFDPVTARKLRSEGLLLPFSALAGKIVDDTLKDAFREFKERREWKIDLLSHSRELLEEHINESIAWVAAAKNDDVPVDRWPRVSQPIDRIYFGEPITSGEWAAVTGRIETCLQNFLDSDLREFFMEYDLRGWLCPKRKSRAGRAPVWFRFNGVPIYASYDFMIRTPDQTLIVDWKTGDPSRGSAKAVRQLHWYALYVIEEFGVPVEQILLLPCWLSVGPMKFRDFTEPVQPAILDEVRGEWKARLEFFDQFVRPFRFKEAESLPFFPLTADLQRCRSCQFRTCDGFRRI